ncbi:MAG TPA: hypothetical protein GYA09_00775 [Firmicutes bacterium]|nr:hypothetical protein [Candidatus Fermentithermobacillaceae bacterium]
MLSKSKIMAVLVTFSLVLVLLMGLLETQMIQSYFLDYSVEQLTYSLDQISTSFAELELSPSDEDISDIAYWIYYNTGLRVLITDSEGEIVADSSEEDSLVGESVDPKSISATVQNGEFNSFKIPSAGKGQIAVAGPWQTGEVISGALLLIGPLQTYAKEGVRDLSPFFVKAGCATLIVGIAASFFLSNVLQKHGDGSDASVRTEREVLVESALPEEVHEKTCDELLDKSLTEKPPEETPDEDVEESVPEE